MRVCIDAVQLDAKPGLRKQVLEKQYFTMEEHEEKSIGAFTRFMVIQPHLQKKKREAPTMVARPL